MLSGEITDPEYNVSNRGCVDITAGDIILRGIVPYVNEEPLMPLTCKADADHITYRTSDGFSDLAVRKDNDEVILTLSLKGYEGIHDAEIIGSASAEGVNRVFIQGYGMEGPSGIYIPENRILRSHGIIGLISGSSAAVLYTDDHTRYRSSFSAARREGLYTDHVRLSAGIDLEGFCNSSDLA